MELTPIECLTFRRLADLATRFIANDSFLAGTLRNVGGSWVFYNMTAGKSSPLSFDHYYYYPWPEEFRLAETARSSQRTDTNEGQATTAPVPWRAALIVPSLLIMPALDLSGVCAPAGCRGRTPAGHGSGLAMAARARRNG